MLSYHRIRSEQFYGNHEIKNYDIDIYIHSMANINNNGHINTFDALVDLIGKDLKNSNKGNKCNCDSCRTSLRKRIIKDLRNELENSKNWYGSGLQECDSINHCPIMVGPVGSTGAFSQIFLKVSGTFTARSSYTMIVDQWGGGAGGGLAKISPSTGNYGGGGGGAGGYASYEVSVSPGQVFIYTIGGVTSPGMNGNPTTFSGGSIVGIVATQGGDAPTSFLGGSGGLVPNVPTDGIGIPGGNGENGFPEIIISSPRVDIYGGKGGDTFAGAGGPGGNSMTSGKSGNQPGGGGGGGGSGPSINDFTLGGAGAAGLIILTVSTATFP
ncbi:MAG: hypothetical protein Hyperionvirus3_103 [Hyperionvirus sp.]|uniref:Uncharacterized protein n=1 Tax=Hyperionvirus sp. TaxID=2487770 RepID=A0A3G5A6T9_9VIRU|nr:MAG: hypothetical protein Hyperionvirus3_103 [Hyperionvirus sp.]